MAFAPALGGRCYVQYKGFDLWHERLVAGIVDTAAGLFIVCTPDYDIYQEELKENVDIAAVRSGPVRGRPPPGVVNAHSFGPLTAVNLRQLMAEGQVMAAQEAEKHEPKVRPLSWQWGPEPWLEEMAPEPLLEELAPP